MKSLVALLFIIACVVSVFAAADPASAQTATQSVLVANDVQPTPLEPTPVETARPVLANPTIPVPAEIPVVLRYRLGLGGWYVQAGVWTPRLATPATVVVVPRTRSWLLRNRAAGFVPVSGWQQL